MARNRPNRLNGIASIGVERMGDLADSHAGSPLLRLENLDVDIPPCAAAIERTRAAAALDADNSYLPFVGRSRLRQVVARHLAETAGVEYHERDCVVAPGGLAGILNVLLAVLEVGDEVVLTDPTYAGLLNRVRLAGGVPAYARLEFRGGDTWRLDRDSLRSAVGPRTRAMLLMSPSMPSGAVLDEGDWALVARLCTDHDLLLVVDAAMERLLFDGRRVVHPAGLDGMRERTVSVGSASKELRMIGWRVGWVIGPDWLMPDVAAVSIANCVVPVGIAQDAAAEALLDSRRSIAAYVGELQRRRDLLLKELHGLPVGVPAGGWSMLLDVSPFGLDGDAMSERLLRQGVAATSMRGWGRAHGDGFIRFVYSNEPCERLRGLGDRVRRALESAA